MVEYDPRGKLSHGIHELQNWPREIRRCRGSRNSTRSVHLQPAGRLRQEFRRPRRQAPDSDLFRDLADYDRAFGVPTADGQVAS